MLISFMIWHKQHSICKRDLETISNWLWRVPLVKQVYFVCGQPSYPALHHMFGMHKVLYSTINFPLQNIVKVLLNPFLNEVAFDKNVIRLLLESFCRYNMLSTLPTSVAWVANNICFLLKQIGSGLVERSLSTAGMLMNFEGLDSWWIETLSKGKEPFNYKFCGLQF